MAQIVKPSYEIISEIDGLEILKHIEKIARTCYRSEDRITDDGESAKNIIKMLVSSGHDAMLEHSSFSVRFTCDIGFYKDITRHRMASYAIESTRWCNYNKEKFGGEIRFIEPVNILKGTPEYAIWLSCMNNIEKDYMAMAKLGCKPDQLRMLLPHSTASEVNVTANLREWRHILKLRTAPNVHPSIVTLLKPLLAELKTKIPVVFEDINP